MPLVFLCPWCVRGSIARVYKAAVCAVFSAAAGALSFVVLRFCFFAFFCVPRVGVMNQQVPALQ